MYIYIYIYIYIYVHTRGETIRVNAILRIVFEYIAIFDWILVKKIFHMGILGFGNKEKNIYPV